MRRRRFLYGSGVVVSTLIAGCSGSQDDEDGTPTDNSTGSPSDTPGDTPGDTPTDDETPTEEDEETETEEDEENLDRPDNYRWDLKPGRNDELRNELGQYVDDPGAVRQDHPAFDFSTERENDDHTVDFEALRMIRDSNFDIFVNESSSSNAPLEDMVQALVDEDMYEQSKNNLFKSHTDSPSTYDEEAWLNADTVEESLDLGHNLLVTIGYDEDTPVSNQETAVAIREAYERHHDYDVLAWEVPMNDGALGGGMMYSPDDDKIRAFAGLGAWNGDGEAQFHTEIQDWRVINDPRELGDADNYQHPILFHTEEWDRQGVSFETAKDDAVGMVFDIATDDYNSFNRDARARNDAISQNITMTTGATEQLTRTMLSYNDSGVDADFSDIRDLASFAVGKYLQDDELNGVIDTVEPGDDSYDEYFGGGFAFYEVEDEEIVDEVRTDQNHEYDNFGEVYDELDSAA